MIFESKQFANQCKWFTTLVSKAENLRGIYKDLKIVNATGIRTIEMGQGQKISRIVAWRFQ
jgi:23S rRNA (adenine1618-N6)-methyltransferase